MFGVDAPSLIQLVKEELARELEVLEGKAERKSVSCIFYIIYIFLYMNNYVELGIPVLFYAVLKYRLIARGGTRSGLAPSPISNFYTHYCGRKGCMRP